MFPNPADGLCADRAPGTVGAARRRRDRRLRAFLKHERMTVAMNLATIQHHSYLRSGVVNVGVQAGSPLAPVSELVAPAPVPPVYSTTTVTADLVYPQFSSTAVEPFAPVVVGSLPPAEGFTEPVYNHAHHERFAAGETTENIAEFPVVQEQVLVQAVPEVVNSLPPVEEFTEPGFNQVHHEQNPAIPVVTEYFPMTDDEGSELAAGVRPAPLEEGRPQGKLQRHAGIGYELVLALDAPVLQMVEQLRDVHHFFARCLPVVAEQVIHVPKIILENIPSRRLCRDTQLAEQLVEVPTIVSYSSLQRNMEHNVDIPVPGGGGRRGRKRRTRLWPKLVRRPGQGSTAFHGAEHQELLGLQGLLPGQGSTTFYGAELQGLPPGQSSTTFCGAELQDFPTGQGSTAFGGAEHQTHRGFLQGHCFPVFGGAQYGFLPGQGSTVFGGAHHGFLPGSSSTAFGGTQHLHHLPPPLSSDGESSGVDGAAEFRPMRFCMYFGSGTCFKENECTFAHAWEELHPDSPEWGL